MHYVNPCVRRVYKYTCLSVCECMHGGQLAPHSMGTGNEGPGWDRVREEEAGAACSLLDLL